MFKCNVCGGTTAKTEYVNEVFTINGRRVLVEHIPAELCGEAAFSRKTTEKIRRLGHEAHPSKTVPLDVFAVA
jgi:YgiT-type zinc finger domain-containing protein